LNRTIAALCLTTALVACDAAPTQPHLLPDAPLTSVFRYEQSFRMFRTACNGDLVTLAGMTEITQVTQGDVLSLTMRSEGLGAGQTSLYKISWTKTLRLVQGVAAHETTTDILRLAGTGATPDTFIRGITSVTVSPDGTTVVDIDFDDQACHGR
jgi:hypothetical protein